MAASRWKSIPCKISELCIDRVLACGQSFRWKEHVPGVWTGVIGDAVWQLKQTDSELFYKVYRESSAFKEDNRSEVPVKAEIKSDNDPDIETAAYAKSRRKKIKTADTFQTVKDEPVNCYITQEPVCKEITQEPVSTTVIKEPVRQDSNGFGNTSHRTEDTFKHENNKDFRIIKDYLQLDINMEDMYKTWSKADKHFEKISKQFQGIRMLRQDPVECLFSFICSSNNHISRIASMVDKLAEHYGKKIVVTDCVEGVDFYTFPKVEALATEGVEEKLRKLGFGYRAKYIQQSARIIEEKGGEQWLYSLRDMEYKDAKKNLVQLCGVGAKVADCVALMCLDQPGSIPVDTHVWQIASRDYMPKLKQAKSLNDKLYDEIGDFFRTLWGPYAGWAHSVLFTADLRQFKDGKKKSKDKKALTQDKKALTQDKKALTQVKKALTQNKKALTQDRKALKRKSDSVVESKQKTKTR